MSNLASEVWLGFLLPCALMGAGIAIDVAVATLSRFRQRAMHWHNWTVPITVTHIIFPALGYYATFYLGRVAHILLVCLSAGAAVLVAAFLIVAVLEWAGKDPVKVSAVLPCVNDKPLTDDLGWVAIVAVSIDAAASGPAKAATGIALEWSEYLIFWSFFVAGATVALIAQISLVAARLLRKVRFHDHQRMAQWLYVGCWLETAVIGGFGVLSAWVALDSLGFSPTSPSLGASILLAAIIAGFPFAIWRAQIVKTLLIDLG